MIMMRVNDDNGGDGDGDDNGGDDGDGDDNGGDGDGDDNGGDGEHPCVDGAHDVMTGQKDHCPDSDDVGASWCLMMMS